MKKLFIFCLLIICCGLQAKQIDEQTAKLVGKNFIVHNVHLEAFAGTVELQKAYVAKHENEIAYYVFNINNNKGFIIVSANDVVEPVLGYSDKGAFSMNGAPHAFIKLINGYKAEIANIVKNKLQSTPALDEKWSALITGSADNNRNVSSVNPLIQTQWNQSPYYNDLCPFQKNSYTVRCVTGCPATAMAQIMKYWNYPATGKSFFAYSTQNNGILSANFGATTYNWSNMPNTISSANTDIATLMYHCGVATKTEYGSTSVAYMIQSASQNGASCEDAYKRYFKYDKTTIQGLKKANFTETQWINKITTELDNNRPVQYAGFGYGGGHTWVCDGYNGNLFHMNWGWGGTCDGNYLISALNPTIDNSTTGAGLGEYNYHHQMVIGIKPPSQTETPKLALNSAITLTTDTTSVNQSVAVNVDLKNVANDGFDGEYCVAVFDSTGEFITILDSIATDGNLLAAGADYSGVGGLTFSDTSIFNQNGIYEVQVYYRATGEEDWQLAGDNFYSNEQTFNIETPPNDVKLYSEISVNPSTLVQGQSADVTVNIFNGTDSTLVGDFSADIIDLDGNLVQTIGSFNEPGLASQTAYSSPVTFSSSSINVAPGTYTIAIFAGGVLCGSDLFDNPITIDVVAPDMEEDSYEPNNDVGTASGLTLSYSGDSGSVATGGANIPDGTTYDYYEVNLPVGYDYFVDINLNDSYHAEDGLFYTLDGIVAYATDTSTYWSELYDDVVPTFVAQGGTNLYLVVSPYFYGDVGTYNLEVFATRIITTATNTLEQKETVNIFPNPTKDNVVIDVSKLNEPATQIKIFNVVGQEVISLDQNISSLHKLSLNGLVDGMYVVKVYTATNIITKQLILKR
ncbi:MAG: thiol protease/hemagglutinin PrtT [Bacteroidia bacterium]